jgi:hypothetical protein
MTRDIRLIVLRPRALEFMATTRWEKAHVKSGRDNQRSRIKRYYEAL